MSGAFDLRLRKLEAKGTSDIAVWCEEPGDVAAIIDQMIAEGELIEADRPWCVHWASAQIAGTHEVALAALA